MCENLSIADKLARVRDKLNRDKVQLWTPPYYVPGIGPSDSDLQTLADRYGAAIGMTSACCLCALNELQSAALENLDSRAKFQESGTASFKVKIPNGNMRVSAQLDELGDVVMRQVADKLDIPKERLRIIGKGKLLDGAQSLASQGIGNNQKFLVIIMEEDDQGRREKEGVHKRLQTAKDDALLLMQRDNKYMTMEDQDGNAVHLPHDEQRALMLALAIHEKGKAALKRGHINEALYLLLEADTEFSHCKSSGLLASVDNYALLYLDIVWCYLKLRSAEYLDDAARRLQMCEKQLIASYGGPGMERVEKIKGTSANERCLLMRLHLMQGIVAYHQNKRDEARLKFNEVQLELATLKIDDDSLKALIEMGFTENEARIALREAKGELSEAVTRIYKKREGRESARKVAKKERKMGKRETISNDAKWVNPKTLTTLTEMGYEVKVARIALRESGNDIEKALILLSDIPGLLEKFPVDVEGSEDSEDGLDEDTRIMDKILKLTSAVDAESVVHIFQVIRGLSRDERGSFFDQANAYDGDKLEIVEILLESLSGQRLDNSNEVAAGPSTSDGGGSSAVDTRALEIANKLLEEQSAYDRFAEDISFEEDDHLDFPLVDEERLLLEYINVLGVWEM